MLLRAVLFTGALLAPATGMAQDEVFQAIAGHSASDVWVIGSRTALRWNGTAWSPAPLPAAPNAGRIVAAWAGGPDNVWAVGERGRVIQWSGTEWVNRTVVLNGAAIMADFAGVAGFAANDVYVAVQSPASDVPGMLVRWDGSAWSTVVTAPLPFRIARGGLAAQGGELLLAGHVPYDPHVLECNHHPLMGPMSCIKFTGVIARLTGEQWTLTAVSHAASGGAAWTSLYHGGTSVLLSGVTARVDQGTAPTGRYRQLRPVDALSVGSFVTPVRGRPASEFGFVRWADVAAPDTIAAVAAAGLFDAGVVIAALRDGRLAARRLGRWSIAPVEGPAGSALSQATGAWGASAAEVWFVSDHAILRAREGRAASIAVAAHCVTLGARASITEGCEMFDPTIRGGGPARRPQGPPAPRRPGP
jgi:hypothetical protein